MIFKENNFFDGGGGGGGLNCNHVSLNYSRKKRCADLRMLNMQMQQLVALEIDLLMYNKTVQCNLSYLILFYFAHYSSAVFKGRGMCIWAL